MDQTPTVDTVLEAINALYNNPINTIKEQASTWLCAFQKSLFAWEISNQLLFLNKDLNSRYFATQTMRIKIQCYFTELPAGSHEDLKNSLLHHVSELSTNTSSPISNQLCLAVADLFCHMVQWENGLSEIVNKLSQSEASMFFLLDILRFIPEEMISSTLRLGLNRRNSIISQLEAAKSAVLSLFAQRINQWSGNMQALTKMYNCLASWWDYTGVMTEADAQVEPLLESAFCLLRNPNTTTEQAYESATQWISAVLHQCRGLCHVNSALLPLLQKTIYSLNEVVSQLCSPLVISASSNSNGTGRTSSSSINLDQLDNVRDRLAHLIHIFTSLSRTLRPFITDSPSPAGSGQLGDLNTLECLLTGLELPQPIRCRRLASITFHSLHGLACRAYDRESMNDNNNNNNSHSHRQRSNSSSSLLTALLPFFTRVVVSLTNLCSHQSDSSSLDSETVDELEDFREDVYALMQDILGLIGSDMVFLELFQHIQRTHSFAYSNNPNASPADVLAMAEPSLFMLTTVGKRLSPHDPEGRLALLIDTLIVPGLNLQCPFPIKHLACQLYAELAHWIALRPSDKRRPIVDQLIGMVEQAANLPLTSVKSSQKAAVASALTALGSLAAIYRPTYPTASLGGQQTRTALLDDHFASLVQRVIQSLPLLAWQPIEQATDLFIGIGRGLVFSIGQSGPSLEEAELKAARQAFPQRLADACQVPLACLTKIMDENLPSFQGSHNSPNDPELWLDYLTALFRTFNHLLHRLDSDHRSDSSSANQITGSGDSQSCLANSTRVVRELVWPVVGRCLLHYASRIRPMEAINRLIRFLVRGWSIHIRDLLPDIAQKMVQAYTASNQHSSFLYLSSVLVDEFGHEADCRSGLLQLYNSLSPPTIELLTRPNELAQQPYAIEDLYRLCNRFIKICPDEFILFLTSSSSSTNNTLGNTQLTVLCNLAVATVTLASPVSDSDNDSSSSPSDPATKGPPAPTAACNQAARFLVDLLHYASEVSECSIGLQFVTLVNAQPNQLIQSASTQSSLAAHHLVGWLVLQSSTSTNSACCGGLRLMAACLEACCVSGLAINSYDCDSDRIPELADLLFQLKSLTSTELFTNWLDQTINGLPLLRDDGLVRATPNQISDLKQSILRYFEPEGLAIEELIWEKD